MKYIMFEVVLGSVTQKIPVVFPNQLVHKEMSDAIGPVLSRHGFQRVRVVSAGDYDAVDCRCTGKSETLKVVCSPDDSDIILKYDYRHGL